MMSVLTIVKPEHLHKLIFPFKKKYIISNAFCYRIQKVLQFGFDRFVI